MQASGVSELVKKGSGVGRQSQGEEMQSVSLILYIQYMAFVVIQIQWEFRNLSRDLYGVNGEANHPVPKLRVPSVEH